MMRSGATAMALLFAFLTGPALADGAVTRNVEYFGKPWLGQPERWGEATAQLIATGDLEYARDVLSGRTRLIADATGFLDIQTASGLVQGCTAALISDRLLLTAAHCVPPDREGRPTRIILLLGYDTAPPENDDDVDYHAVETTPVERGSETGVDYAILQLEQPIRHIAPISGSIGEPGPGQKLTILAHPGGSPLLISQQNCRTKRRNPVTAKEIVHECMTEVGSSGALVYDDDWRIVGLHSRAVFGTKYAVRMAALLEASPTLRGLFGAEPEPEPVGDVETAEPEVRMACPPAATLPEGLTCEVGSGGALEWGRLALLEPAPVYDPPARAPFGISADKWISGTPGEPKSVFKECAECPEMVVIPAGRFLMGSPEDEVGRNENEGPQREIRIGAPFAMGRTEVTVGEWRRFVAATGYVTGDSCRWYSTGKWTSRDDRNWLNPGYDQTDDHPVVCVSWEDAQAYIGWLNQRTPGAPYRLPGEAEWEYAARAGTPTARYWGDDREQTQACRYANVTDQAGARQYGWHNKHESVFQCDDGYPDTAPVGRFGANRFALSDMLGNAWEWTADCWAADLSRIPADSSAYFETACHLRVLRGGHATIFPKHLRSAYRDRSRHSFRYDTTGFRIARTLQR